MHGRLPGRAIRSMEGNQQGNHQGNHDKAATETEQHGGHAGQPAAEKQDAIHRNTPEESNDRNDIPIRGGFRRLANNRRISATLTTMLNIPLADVDRVARPIVAIGTDYSPGTLLDFIPIAAPSFSTA